MVLSDIRQISYNHTCNYGCQFLNGSAELMKPFERYATCRFKCSKIYFYRYASDLGLTLYGNCGSGSALICQHRRKSRGAWWLQSPRLFSVPPEYFQLPQSPIHFGNHSVKLRCSSFEITRDWSKRMQISTSKNLFRRKSLVR